MAGQTRCITVLWFALPLRVHDDIGVRPTIDAFAAAISWRIRRFSVAV